MVADPALSPQSTGRDSMICPRCDTRLIITYDEPVCLRCGFVNYFYVPIQQPTRTREQNLISAGTRAVLRYVGEFPSLQNTLTYVRAQRVRNRVAYEVTCPFCGGTMTQSSLSGKRREAREERYKCSEGHRVSLTPGRHDSLGWK